MATRRYDQRMRYVRHRRVRKKVIGVEQRPRLSVFRSSKHVYAQIVDDTTSRTLVAASSLKADHGESKSVLAKTVGTTIAERSLKAGIGKVVFDRSGYAYHGVVRALADAARENGLNF